MRELNDWDSFHHPDIIVIGAIENHEAGGQGKVIADLLSCPQNTS